MSRVPRVVVWQWGVLLLKNLFLLPSPPTRLTRVRTLGFPVVIPLILVKQVLIVVSGLLLKLLKT